MLHSLYTIYDTKALIWNPPFNMRTDVEAIRAFASTANDLSTSINAHPADYALYRIGTFDDSNGEIKSTPPEMLGMAVDFLQPEAQQPLLDQEGLQ